MDVQILGKYGKQLRCRNILAKYGMHNYIIQWCVQILTILQDYAD